MEYRSSIVTIPRLFAAYAAALLLVAGLTDSLATALAIASANLQATHQTSFELQASADLEIISENEAWVQLTTPEAAYDLSDNFVSVTFVNLIERLRHIKTSDRQTNWKMYVFATGNSVAFADNFSGQMFDQLRELRNMPGSGINFFESVPDFSDSTTSAPSRGASQLPWDEIQALMSVRSASNTAIVEQYFVNYIEFLAVQQNDTLEAYRTFERLLRFKQQNLEGAPNLCFVFELGSPPVQINDQSSALFLPESQGPPRQEGTDAAREPSLLQQIRDFTLFISGSCLTYVSVKTCKNRNRRLKAKKA